MIMPTKDRACSAHFFELMKKQNLKRQTIEFGKKYGWPVVDDEE